LSNTEDLTRCSSPAKLCRSTEVPAFFRDPKTKALVRPLAGGTPKSIMGSWLAPVASLMQASNLLKLHEGAHRLLLGILAEVRALERNRQDVRIGECLCYRG
jgi:hypothetical protein